MDLGLDTDADSCWPCRGESSPFLLVLDKQDQILARLDELLLQSFDLHLECRDWLAPLVRQYLEKFPDGHGSSVDTLGIPLFLLSERNKVRLPTWAYELSR